MIVHIMPQTTFLKDIISLLELCNIGHKHIVLVYTREKLAVTSAHDNIEIVRIYNAMLHYRYIVKYLRKADAVVLHSLFCPISLLVLLYIHRQLLLKANLILWGGDLYCYKDINKNFKLRIREYFRKPILENFSCISSLTVGDYELAERIYHVQGKYFPITYSNPEKFNICFTKLRGLDSDKEQSNIIHIQIGNSATETNKHMEILEELAKFKHENIKIYAPLSYGDLNYAKYIIDKGHCIFGEKFIPLTKFMKFDEYICYLNKIDIAIFNNNRQQALGNISLLGMMGAKIYIRNDTSMWKHYNDYIKFKCYDINKLSTATYNEFLDYPQEIKNINVAKLQSYMCDTERIKAEWCNMMCFLLENRPC